MERVEQWITDVKVYKIKPRWFVISSTSEGIEGAGEMFWSKQKSCLLEHMKWVEELLVVNRCEMKVGKNFTRSFLEADINGRLYWYRDAFGDLIRVSILMFRLRVIRWGCTWQIKGFLGSVAIRPEM